MNRDSHDEIQGVLDGALSPQEFDDFQQRLRDNPELFKLYCDYALLHHSLSEEYEEGKPDGLALVPPRPRLKVVAAWFAGVAAVIVGIALTNRSSPATPPPPAVATARFSEDAVWRIEGNNRSFVTPLSLTTGATVTVSHGQALLANGSGANLLMDGSATLTIVSSRKYSLTLGRAYRQSTKPNDEFQLETPAIIVSEMPPAEFGAEVRANLPDEVHVISGRARVQSLSGGHGQALAAGDAARATGPNEIERFPADPPRFAKTLMEFFDAVPRDFSKMEWRVDFGKPSILPDRIDGENYTIFHKLPAVCSTTPVLLATMETANPSKGQFQTDGWAGLSFFGKGTELLFFGDCFGPEPTWGLDVKQKAPIVLPVKPLTGARTVTLRYDRRSGDVSLHEGRPPLGPAFCAGKIPPNLAFDQIRLGASSNAALAIRSLKIRVTPPSP